MKKLFLMFILLCTAVIGALAQTTSPETLSGGWTRVWSDEFTGSTLNTAVWNVEQVTDPANNELQRYNNDGVSVSGGNLVLTAKRETKSGDTRSFTSGRVNSQGKYTFQYDNVYFYKKAETQKINSTLLAVSTNGILTQPLNL